MNGTGWIPVNFSGISQGSPFGSIPTDPTDSSSSRLYYTYTTDGAKFELTAALESQKYKLGGSNDAVGTDGGTLTTVYEKGTKLGLEPLDYGAPSLVGYWTFDEGNGTTAYDWSGSGKTCTGVSGWGLGKIGNSAIVMPNSISCTTPSVTTGPITYAAWIYSQNVDGDVIGFEGYNPTWGYCMVACGRRRPPIGL